jgi:choline dehydrogenase-like flavoprotein
MDHPGIKAAAVVPNDAWPVNTKLIAKAPKNFIHWTYELDNKLVRDKKLINARLSLDQKSELDMSNGIESMHQISKAHKKDLEIDSYFDHIANILLDLDMVSEAVARKQFNTHIFDHADSMNGYIVNAMMEQSPDSQNRIRLSDEKDSMGQNRLHLDWRITDYDKKNLEQVIDNFAKSLSSSRFCRVRSLIGQHNDETERRFEEIMDFGYHHMGGTRMSDSPKSGVVDKNLKVFNRKNFYVLGSSVFPTGGYVPPTLTVVALAIRLSDHLRKRYE